MPARSFLMRLFRFAVPLIAIASLLLPRLAFETVGQSSPARGDAQVIAQGLAAPPADRVAWRVVEQPIPARIDARPSNRLESSTGFLLADSASVFVADQRTKLRTRLSPGEAQFVPSGSNQTWANLDEGAGSAYTLELVDREVAREVAGGAELVYASSSFQMLPGDYDLDLIRDDVPGGERARIDQFNFPVMVLVTGGSVEITSSRSDEKVRLDDGEAIALRGELTIRARGDDTATFVAAIVGDAISGGTAAPTPVPTDTPEDEPKEKATSTPKPKRTPTPETDVDEEKPGVNDGSSLRIAVRLCRAGMTYFAIDPRGCARADEGFQLALVAEDGTRLRMSDASRVAPSFVRWSGLEPGEYVLVVGKMPDGYLSYSLDGFICCSASEGYLISIGEDQLIDGTLYLFQSPWGLGAPPAPTPAPQVQPTQVAQEPEPGVDSDGDGLSDELEINVFGTSPNLVDSDGDTIPDGVEAFGTNGWLTAPALPDTDGDGVDDNVEIENGTSPVDPSSR